MNNKGVSEGMWFAMVGILTILSLLFISQLFGKTKEASEDLTDYRICKDGNRGIIQARLKLLGDWVIAEKGIKHCRTEPVNVKKGQEYETIAKKMSLCWDEYLEGKEALFKTKDNDYCAFCSVLEFEDKNKKLNQLSKYLSNNKASATGEKTYMEYMTGIESKENKITHLENLELDNLNIDTSKKLAVMFIIYKDAYPGSIINQPQTLTAFGGTAAGTVIGTVAVGLSYIGGLGLCSTIIGCSAGAFLIAGAGGASGYLIGSDRSEDWRAKILVTEYDKQNLEQLKCTQLEGLDHLKIQEK